MSIVVAKKLKRYIQTLQKKIIPYAIVFLSILIVMLNNIEICDNNIDMQVKANNTDNEIVKIYIQYNNQKGFSERFSYSSIISLVRDQYSNCNIVAKEKVKYLEIRNIRIDVSGPVNSEYILKNVSINGKNIDIKKIYTVHDAVLLKNESNDIYMRVTGSDPHIVFGNLNQFSHLDYTNILLTLFIISICYCIMRKIYIISNVKLSIVIWGVF